MITVHVSCECLAFALFSVVFALFHLVLIYLLCSWDLMPSLTLGGMKILPFYEQSRDRTTLFVSRRRVLSLGGFSKIGLRKFMNSNRTIAHWERNPEAVIWSPLFLCQIRRNIKVCQGISLSKVRTDSLLSVNLVRNILRIFQWFSMWRLRIDYVNSRCYCCAACLALRSSIQYCAHLHQSNLKSQLH